MRPRQRGGEKEREGDRDEAETESGRDLIIWTGQKGNTGGLRQREVQRCRERQGSRD